MSKFVDLTNQKFNKLLVLSQTERRSKYGAVYWKCLCDCGNETEVLATSLKTGNTTSCGCQKVLYKNKYMPQEATARRVYKNYKNEIKKNGGNISFENFWQLSQLPCYYCGTLKSNYLHSENNSEWHKNNGDFYYNGLDRVDTHKGYYLDNIVPSCKYCNKSKCALSIKDFADHIQHMINTRELVYSGNLINVKALTNINLINIPLNRNGDYSIPVDTIKVGDTLGKWKILAEEPGVRIIRKYLCECACGSTKIVEADNLKKGKSRSCGKPQCYQEYPSIVYAFKHIWNSRYKDADLSFEKFYTLAQMPCSYCGRKPFRKLESIDGIITYYNGLDRIDPNREHYVDNIVPCCYDCNKIKNDRNLIGFKLLVNKNK